MERLLRAPVDIRKRLVSLVGVEPTAAPVQGKRTPSVATEGVRLLKVCEDIGYGDEAAAAGVIRQGTSSPMRLMVCPLAILIRISRR